MSTLVAEEVRQVYGCIGLEADVLVTDAAAVYLAEPQREVWVKQVADHDRFVVS